jgi:hypothetical protein
MWYGKQGFNWETLDVLCFSATSGCRMTAYLPAL